LLAVNALVLGLYVFARLERPVAESFGPLGEGVYDLFNPSDQTSVPLSATARSFVNDVKALGGEANVAVIKPGFLGIFGRSEWFNVSFQNKSFDDEALGRLAASYGNQIGGLYLQNTGVTDAGLPHLKKLTMLRHLQIRNYAQRARRGTPRPTSAITDAGLVHLKGLTQLWSLSLCDVPVTDAGLDPIKNLPALQSLYLSQTKVQGPGLARLKSLPLLSVLYLDGSEMTEGGLSALSGATSLQTLSLSRVPLTDKALPLLKAIPRLDRLEITGCGFLDEEVDALVKSKPGLRVVRQ
jgi:hypothetical protein